MIPVDDAKTPFYFDERKTKKRENVQAKLLIGHGKQTNKKNRFVEACDGVLRKLVDNFVPRTAKKSTKK